MCYAQIAMAGAQIAGMAINSQNQWAATVTGNRLQKAELVRQANSADAALLLENANAFESAREGMNQHAMDSLKAISTVKAAASESNLEGRSMERTIRGAENAALKTRGALQENYERDYANILAQRIDNRTQLIAQMDAIRDPNKPPTMAERFGLSKEGLMAGIPFAFLDKENNTKFVNQLWGQ